MTEFLTPDEVCKYLRLNKTQLRSWRYRKIGLKYIKLHGRILYRKEDVEAFLIANEVKPEGDL